MKKNIKFFFLSILILIILVLYLQTTYPCFKNNDSPETSASAFTLGITHPPAYPLFNMLAKIFTFINIGNIAFRVNLFSIFLSLITILISYFILVKLSKIMRLKINFFEILFLLLVLSFSYIFWNQSIEAKGGIYILNLLLFALIILLILEIEDKFNIKKIYLLVYLYGLSLTNHWPSMIILFPLILYLFIKYFKKINLNQHIIKIVLFFIIGITPYIFLLIRSQTNPVLNWGEPSDLKNLLWVILRKAYAYPVAPSISVYIYQIQEFLKIFFSNYFLFFIFIFIGGYFLFKDKKNIFFILLSAFLLIVIAVVFYNRTKKEVIYLIDIFLLPSEYICFIFLSIGILKISKLLREKKFISVYYIYYFIVIVALFFLFIKNFNMNNKRYNYISYDYGNNLLKTMENNSIYIGDGDYNLMPVFYIQNVKKNFLDIKVIAAPFLIFKWGINQFRNSVNMNLKMKPYHAKENVKAIIDSYINTKEIYISSFFPRFDNEKLRYNKIQKGIIVKITEKNSVFSEKIFQLYVYRGIYNKLQKEDIDLITWYPVCMVNQANYLLDSGYAENAIYLYKKSLLFPGDKPLANIYYNISLAYSKLNDFLNEIKYLKKVIEYKKDFLFAYERLGILYYEHGIFLMAKKYLGSAIKYNSKNNKIIAYYEKLKNKTEKELLEISLIMANNYLIKMKYNKAKIIYDFLLENGYKRDIIYRNIGVYYFKINKYQEAIKHFEMSQNETKTPDVYLYIAYTYYKMGKINKAREILKEGIVIFKNNKKLIELYNKLNRIKR